MNNKLTTALTLKHGGVLKTRTAMAPMEVMVSNPDGSVGSDDLNFYSIRSGVAGLIITGAANINEAGKAFARQLSIANDDMLPGLKKLASAIKKDGNKAIVQLYHGGREAKRSYDELGEALAPSTLDYSFLPFVPRGMTEAEIEQTIADYAKATKRAIEAGFDGVEIHGANHYLLQQFFSSFSNQRTDHWGGSLEKRMNFPLAVTEAVVKAVQESVSASDDFIIGYRFSPEEIHGETIGYTVDDSLKLIDKIADYDLDYIHTSIFSKYDDVPAGHKKSFGQLVKETVGERTATIIVSSIFTAEDASNALNYADIVAIGREALIEPEFATKLLAGQEDKIVTEVTKEREASLAFTPELKEWFLMEGSPLPPLPGKENL